MKNLKRYWLGELARTYASDKDNVVCRAYDVDKLEASHAELEAKCAELENKCAELLEVIEAIDNTVKIGCPVGSILAIIRDYRRAARKAARAAIAKAEGVELP